MTSVKIPETVTTIENAFLGNKNLKTVYIPTSVTSIVDTFGKSTWVEAPTNLTILYIGKDASVLSTCTAIANANVIEAKNYNEGTAYTGFNLVVGYSHCIAYNNSIHGESIVENIAVTVYTAPIAVSYKCSLCDYTVANTEISPLFACLGYSTPEDGRGEITLGYTINVGAVAEYSKVSGKTINYGIFAVLKDKIGDNDIFGEDGNVADGVVNVEFSQGEYVAVEFRIFGFTDENKDVKLAMGAYVSLSDDETLEYSYIQYGKPNANEKYSFISYDDIVNADE